MEMPDFVRIGDLEDEIVTDIRGQKWPATYLKSRDRTTKYYNERIVEALRKENEELKAKLDKAKWQQIYSAPKDGTAIIVNASNIMFHDFSEVEWKQDKNYKMGWVGYDCEGEFTVNPTHWMPLPDAPEQR